jgi:hypothetical protein
MIPGIMAAQMRVESGGGTLWTPLNMATVPQIYLDAEDSTVTDVSGFASAISNLGAMGANGDFSQGTAGRRPAILAAELNGKRVLSFDGSNNILEGGSTAQKDLLRNVSAAWAFFVYKKRGTDGSNTQRRIFHCSKPTSLSVRFTCEAGNFVAGNTPAILAARLDSDSQVNLASGTVLVGAYTMNLYALDYTNRTGRIYIAGALDSENTTLTASAGNTSNTASADPLTIGARFGPSVAADVDIAGVVISNTYPSADDIDKLFGWAAHKYGLTASLPGGHPYKSSPPTV